MDIAVNSIVAGLMVGTIYGLVAVGFVIIYKCSGVLNLSQGALALFGGYVSWSFMYELGLPPWLGVLLALVVAAIMGLLVERFIMRPLLGQPMMALVMVTIALTEILRGGVITYWGALDLRYVTIIPEGTIRMGFVAISNQQLASVLVTLVLFAVILLLFRYSRWGLAMRAVAEGHQLVRSMGISVRTILGITWAIAAVVATLGGVLLGSIGGFGISMWEIALMAIPAAFIGGLDSVHGAIVGGLIVGVLEKVINLYVGFAFGLPAAFLVLVLIMFFRPYGIWGLIRIERV